jgi:hypothetical protein
MDKDRNVGGIVSMFRWTCAGLLCLWAVTVVPAYGEAPRYTLGASQIEILTPAPDAVVTSSTVQIDFRLLKGRKDNGDHVHVKVDGEKWGTIKTPPVTLKNLSPGPHTVILETATKDHVLVGNPQSVRFIVQPSGP